MDDLGVAKLTDEQRFVTVPARLEKISGVTMHSLIGYKYDASLNLLVAACLGYFPGPLPGRIARALLALIVSTLLIGLFLAAVFFSATELAEAFA